eukprot:6025920-Pleurochrysis_carterae.AAC.7
MCNRASRRSMKWRARHFDADWIKRGSDGLQAKIHDVIQLAQVTAEVVSSQKQAKAAGVKCTTTWRGACVCGAD